MLKERTRYLGRSFYFFEEKKIKHFKDSTLMFSYTPVDASEPWNAWSPFPWENDPYNYRDLRQKVVKLINLFSKKKLSRSKFFYLLEVLENNHNLFEFSFFHSNHVAAANPLGGYVRDKGNLEVQVDAWFDTIPYTYFLLFRFFLLNFYRERTLSKGKLSSWGEGAVAFLPVPSRLWNIKQHPGYLQVLWMIPIRELIRWSLFEEEHFAEVSPEYQNSIPWWNAHTIIRRKLWSPFTDFYVFSQILEQVKEYGINKSTETAKKRFFLNFFLKLKHPNYDALFVGDLSKLKYYNFIFPHYKRKYLYVTKEADFLRLYIFSVYTKLQLNMDHTDRVLDFVNWTEYLYWNFPLRNEKEVLNELSDIFNFNIGLPVFSNKRKTFWK